MREFVSLRGFAAPLPEANVDTDKIIAAKFLKTISRHGLGKGLFSAMRYDERQAERADFILNREPWRQASILLAFENFGCGSSREHAPWALTDFGIRAIIAPSFADIFYSNCIKNGILPITIDRILVEGLMRDAADPDTACFEINLPEQIVSDGRGGIIPFLIDPDHKNALLLGIDEIARSEELIREIEEFENAVTYCAPPIPRAFAGLD